MMGFESGVRISAVNSYLHTTLNRLSIPFNRNARSAEFALEVGIAKLCRELGDSSLILSYLAARVSDGARANRAEELFPATGGC
jgi:hypothetical protein